MRNHNMVKDPQKGYFLTAFVWRGYGIAPRIPNPYSAQQESFVGSLKREMAAIFSASAMVGYTCS